MVDLIRYTQTGYDRGMEPAHEGEWVLYEDAADRIAALEAEVRECRMQAISDGAQLQDAYEARMKAEAERDALRAELSAMKADRPFILGANHGYEEAWGQAADYGYEEAMERVAKEARRYASNYPEASDGRNTFTMFAEWADRAALTPADPHPVEQQNCGDPSTSGLILSPGLDGVANPNDRAGSANPVASADPQTAPGMTDLMVSPESIDAFMEANPLPADPQPKEKDDCDWTYQNACEDFPEETAGPQPAEPGGFVGDIYYGDPVHTTRGTHRWDGSQWHKLPDENEVLLGLLAKAREKSQPALDAEHNKAIRAAIAKIREIAEIDAAANEGQFAEDIRWNADNYASWLTTLLRPEATR